jgi:hypothetical protein
VATQHESAGPSCEAGGAPVWPNGEVSRAGHAGELAAQHRDRSLEGLEAPGPEADQAGSRGLDYHLSHAPASLYVSPLQEQHPEPASLSSVGRVAGAGQRGPPLWGRGGSESSPTADSSAITTKEMH